MKQAYNKPVIMARNINRKEASSMLAWGKFLFT